DIAQEQLLQRELEPRNRGIERQPLHRLDVAGRLAADVAHGLHAPELDQLGLAPRLVGDRAEIFADLDREAGFLDHLTLGRRDRLLLALELTLWQHPGVVLAALHQRDQRAWPVSHHYTASTHDRRPRHAAPHFQRLKHELTSLWRVACSRIALRAMRRTLAARET